MVVEARGHIRMFGSQGLLLNRQRAQVERLGLRVLALQVIELRQVVEKDGSGGISRHRNQRVSAA